MKRFVAILLILVMIFSLSAMAFAKDAVVSPEGSNEDPSQPSPQTGDLAGIYWVAVATIMAIGFAFFCGKKLMTEK